MKSPLQIYGYRPLQVSTWPSSMKLATRSVLAVAEMCMKQSRIPSFKIRLLGAFEKSALFTFSPISTFDPPNKVVFAWF